MNSLSEIRKNIGAFFYQESIGNKVDRNGNQFLSSFYLNDEDYAEKFLASIKYVDNFNGCSFIPNKKKGDEFRFIR